MKQPGENRLIRMLQWVPISEHWLEYTLYVGLIMILLVSLSIDIVGIFEWMKI